MSVCVGVGVGVGVGRGIRIVGCFNTLRFIRSEITVIQLRICINEAIDVAYITLIDSVLNTYPVIRVLLTVLLFLNRLFNTILVLNIAVWGNF